ncbi:aromatic-ring-hydroxylating dioxygenase subunit beta [Emcibacter sp.]|uniref:aromatic-ring-hydroxylating dioxygenase subunit beta n=1 Tax=Emcibacter sp. TaxID=1979954 RepID=UPI002AA79280|nr:aromatic-ring-hydroxylating dioxygenase subunit beta [Emcibacter sp.]
MTDREPVSMEVHHEIEQHLYREARILDNEMMREWLTDMVDPEIRYQLVIRDERFRKDKSPDKDREVMPFDDDYGILDLRVRQFETGMQQMMDPAQRMFRMVTNVEAFPGENEGEFSVSSYGFVSRFRRQYESESSVYSRKDVLRRGEGGKLRLLSRRIELGERVVRNKNLLFFL